MQKSVEKFIFPSTDRQLFTFTAPAVDDVSDDDNRRKLKRVHPEQHRQCNGRMCDNVYAIAGRINIYDNRQRYSAYTLLNDWRPQDLLQGVQGQRSGGLDPRTLPFHSIPFHSIQFLSFFRLSLPSPPLFLCPSFSPPFLCPFTHAPSPSPV
jgi:hypothetical protein